MKIELLISFDNVITLKNLTDNSIRLIKEKQILKSVLDGYLMSPILSKVEKSKFFLDNDEYKDVVIYDSKDVSISFIDYAINYCDDIISSFDKRKIQDIYNEFKQDILNSSINNYSLSVLPFYQSINIERLDQIDDVLLYEINKKKDGSINLEDLNNMESLINLFIDKYGILDTNGIDTKGIIFGHEKKVLLVSGSPISEILDRKVYEYGKKHGRIS